MKYLARTQRYNSKIISISYDMGFKASKPKRLFLNVAATPCIGSAALTTLPLQDTSDQDPVNNE